MRSACLGAGRSNVGGKGDKRNAVRKLRCRSGGAELLGDEANKCWTGIMLAKLLRVCIHSQTDNHVMNIIGDFVAIKGASSQEVDKAASELDVANHRAVSHP